MVSPSAAPELNARLTISPGRLDAVVDSPDAERVAVEYQASFTAYPSTHAPDPTPLSATDRALYTRPNEGFAQVSERVRNLRRRPGWGAGRHLERGPPVLGLRDGRAELRLRPL